MKRSYFLLGGLIIVGTVLATAMVFPTLPDKVPAHWNIRDQVDRYGSRSTVFVIPAVMAATMLLMAALPWLSPRSFQVNGQQQPAYLQIMVALLAFLAFMQYVTLSAARGRHVAMGATAMGGICAVSAVIGALLPRVPRNFYVGVRTPWTLASSKVWEATHRFAAKTFVAAGVVGVVLALAMKAFWPPLVALIAGTLAPAVYSLVYYKRLERHGEI